MQPVPNDPNNLALLRSLFLDPNNRCCAECNSTNVPYVCIKLGVFICPTCAHFLSIIGFKVRPMMGSTFTDDEISRLQSIGNLVSKQFWLARWSPIEIPMPPPDDPKLEAFLRLKYIEKRWTSSLSTSDGFSSPSGGQLPLQQPQQQSNLGNSNNSNGIMNLTQSDGVPIVNKQQQQQQQQQQSQQGFSPFHSPHSSPKPGRHLIDDFIGNGYNSGNPLKFSGGMPPQQNGNLYSSQNPPLPQPLSSSGGNKMPFDPFSPIKSNNNNVNGTSSSTGFDNHDFQTTTSTTSPYSQPLSTSGNQLIDILGHPAKSKSPSPSNTPQQQGLSPQHHSSDFKVHLIDIPNTTSNNNGIGNLTSGNSSSQPLPSQQHSSLASNPFTTNHEPLINLHDDLHTNNNQMTSPTPQQSNPFVENNNNNNNSNNKHPHHLHHHHRHHSANISNSELSSISLTLLSPSPSPSPSLNYQQQQQQQQSNNIVNNFSNLAINTSTTSSICSTGSSSNITINNSNNNIHHNLNNSNNILNNINNINNSGNIINQNNQNNNNNNNNINTSGANMISPSPSPNPFLPVPIANTNNTSQNNIVTPIPINPFLDSNRSSNHPQQMYIQQQQQQQQAQQQSNNPQTPQQQQSQPQHQYLSPSSAPLQPVIHSPIPLQPQHASSQFLNQQQFYQQPLQQPQQPIQHPQSPQPLQQQQTPQPAQPAQPIPPPSSTPQPLHSSTDEDPTVLEVLNLKKLYDMSMMDKEEFEHRRRQIIDNLTKTTSPIPQGVVSAPAVQQPNQTGGQQAPQQSNQPPPQQVQPQSAPVQQSNQPIIQPQPQPQPPIPDPRLTGTERVIRHRFDAKLGKWVQTATIVITEPTPFAEGAMRKAFRMKDLSAEGPSSQMVAKLFKDANEDRMVYFKDVEMQTYAKEIAERFNLKGPPKKIDFVPAFVMELVERQGKPFCAVEYFIEGKYEKHNNNFGYKNDFDRNTPQAFSHFSYEDSGCQLIVVDIQGVGDVYTDPQIHSADGQGFGKGNLGIEGIKRFFSTHQCNPICHFLGLSAINPKPVNDESGTMPKPPSLGQQQQSYVRPSSVYPPNLQQSFSFNFPPLKDQQQQQQNIQQQQQQLNNQNNNQNNQNNNNNNQNNNNHAPPQTPLPPLPQKEKPKIEVFGDMIRKLVS